MKVTLYVLKSCQSGGKRYIGITNDLRRRLREHRSIATKAGQVLGEFRIVHTEQFSDHASARVRERFLKSGKGRQWLDELESRTWLARGE